MIIILALVFLWPLALHPNWMPMTNLDQVTDYIISHLAYANYIHKIWTDYGILPLWNSSMLSGMPLIADPLSGYFYIPNWITYIYPIPFSFNFLIFVHICWTGLGLFFFLKANHLQPYSSFFGAVAWMGTTKLIGYVGGGQVSSIYAIAWFPWLLFFLLKLSRDFKIGNTILAAGVLALNILIDVRWGFMGGLLSITYFSSFLPSLLKNKRKLFSNFAFFILFTFLFSSVLLLPLIELMQHTERSGLTIIERSILSLGFGHLIGLLTPQFGLIYELITYVGIVVLVLSFWGFAKKQWFWVLFVCGSIILALGQNTPAYGFLGKLIPGFNWLRTPSRFWFFVALGIAILSAFGIETIINRSTLRAYSRKLRLSFFALSMTTIFIAVGIFLWFPPVPKGVLTLSIFVPSIGFLIFALLVTTLPSFSNSAFKNMDLYFKINFCQQAFILIGYSNVFRRDYLN